jgi:hypothetical protein
MENTELIDHLQYFANKVISIPLKTTKIEFILYYDSEDFLQSEFLDSNSFLLQDCIVKADDKIINLILKNISTAIETSCGNDFDLKALKPIEQFTYSVRVKDEKSISKRYSDYSISPSDENEFKELWLKQFIENLIIIRNNIKSILSLDENLVIKNKLKTNLTVREIAYLFRALYEEGIIESKHKTDIFNFIAESFSSKQKEDVSANSIKNAFDVPDFNAVDFWHEKFIHLMQRAKKDKEK